MSLNVLDELVAPVIDDNINGQPICYDTSPGVLNVVNLATGGSEDFTYVWENTSSQEEIGSGVSVLVDNLTSDQTYDCTAIDALCGSIVSNSIAVQVFDDLEAPIISNASPPKIGPIVRPIPPAS